MYILRVKFYILILQILSFLTVYFAVHLPMQLMSILFSLGLIWLGKCLLNRNFFLLLIKVVPQSAVKAN